MDYLFTGTRGFEYFETKRNVLKQEIESLSNDELQSSDESLKIILIAKHTIKPIEFAAPVRTDNGEVQIDISRDPRFGAYFFRAPGEGPVYKKGRQLAVHLSFSCDEELFKVHPSSYTTVYPYAEVRTGEIAFNVNFFSDVDTPEQVSKNIDKEVDLVKRYSAYLNNDVNSFNSSIASMIDAGLSARRKKLSLDESILGQLGVQKQVIRPNGFVKPEKRLELKVLENQEKEIDPSIEMQTYSEIIGIINSLGINLERSCQRLRAMGEEPLRDSILSALDTFYKGMASGETFNKEGKTDILLKYQDKNLFIAECKIWGTESYFTKGIEQLLSYLTWRDSKTSYIIFSKNKDVRNVIDKSRALLQADPRCIAKVSDISDSCTTYRFRHNTETTNECLVTLHVFDLGAS